jgi:hypothetical protein
MSLGRRARATSWDSIANIKQMLIKLPRLKLANWNSGLANWNSSSQMLI